MVIWFLRLMDSCRLSETFASYIRCCRSSSSIFAFCSRIFNSRSDTSTGGFSSCVAGVSPVVFCVVLVFVFVLVLAFVAGWAASSPVAITGNQKDDRISAVAAMLPIVIRFCSCVCICLSKHSKYRHFMQNFAVFHVPFPSGEVTLFSQGQRRYRRRPEIAPDPKKQHEAARALRRLTMHDFLRRRWFRHEECLTRSSFLQVSHNIYP